MAIEKIKKENLHKGHRERVKQKFLADGFTESTPDHEILEMLLFYSVPQKDTNELAHMLLRRFGSFTSVLEARAEELTEITGISMHSAVLIKMLLPIFRRYNERKNADKVKFEGFDQFARYIRDLYIGETEEVVRMFLFNNKNEFVGKEIISVGDVSTACMNNRKIIDSVLKHDATGVIIAHNHPQGFAVVSKADRTATIDIKGVVNCVNASLYDHVIIGNNQYKSMRCDKEYEFFWG